MAITYDGYYAMATWNSGNANFKWNHTIGSGSKRLLLVALRVNFASATTTCTYNTVAMSKLVRCANATKDGLIDLWYMKQASLPAAGTYEIACTHDGPGGQGIFGDSISYSNVDQTTTFGTPVSSTKDLGTGATNVSMTIAGSSGDVSIGISHIFDSTIPTNQAGQGLNQQVIVQQSAGSNDAQLADKASGASITIGWDISSGNNGWAEWIGVSILNGGGGANTTGPFPLFLPGVAGS